MKNLNKSDYVILGMLGKNPCSGYTLKKIMAKNASFYGVESNAQIYPVLKNLEKHGYVTSTVDESSGKRQTRIFSISETGFAELQNWLTSNNNEVFFYREDFLVKLSLAQFMNINEFSSMIENYKLSLAQKTEEIHKLKQHVELDHKGRADQKYLLFTYDHLEEVLKAKLKWCEKVMSEMRK